jgi:hypothetical protein
LREASLIRCGVEEGSIAAFIGQEVSPLEIGDDLRPPIVIQGVDGFRQLLGNSRLFGPPVDASVDVNAAASEKITDGLRRNLTQEMPIGEWQAAPGAKDAASTPSLRLASQRCTSRICATPSKNQAAAPGSRELRAYSLACTTYVLLGWRGRIAMDELSH